ncbi:alcohol dehydrogenase catalytic domain-containing protein [Cumulibacter manganitolerans]|uniref:alcohol dehydrogenase catalytic domain-containing protein n=1 Tax=Cumulibacter manganitolerans TaxID=1884992 RepID=UPI00129701C1|nr:alcohol dehydrogenase catalytic domain-containing protein [Cumulibacter manganitolerans]
MWAKHVDRPRHVAGIEVDPPSADDLGEGEVLLRFLAGGLCGSDGPFYRGNANPWLGAGEVHPGTPMHEIVGEVVATRSELHEVGTRVVGWADGWNALQEYVVVRGSSVLAYDPELSPAHALMLQPLACVIYAVEQLGPTTGRDAAVLGLGPIGVLFAHVLANGGAASVTGVDVIDRSDVAGFFGVDRFEHHTTSSWLAALVAADGPRRSEFLASGTNENRPDLIVEAIGHQVSSLTHALEAVRERGLVFYFGIPDDPVYPVPVELMLRKHLTLKSGTTLERRRVLAAANDYVKRYPEFPGRYVTRTYPVAEADAAYRAAFTPAPGQLKVAITDQPA